MTDRSSRYAGVPIYQVEDAAAGRIELHQPRLRPLGPLPPAAVLRVAASDRLDLLAWNHLGDPYQYWRIADANPEVDLDRLVEPGRPLRIPRKPS